jgi:hypothetical protein
MHGVQNGWEGIRGITSPKVLLKISMTYFVELDVSHNYLCPHPFSHNRESVLKFRFLKLLTISSCHHIFPSSNILSRYVLYHVIANQCDSSKEKS